MRYPANLTPEENGYSVSFPDIPEALTCGDTEEEALRHAVDALESALDFYFDQGRPVPAPSAPAPGQRLVELPEAVWERVLLFNAQL